MIHALAIVGIVMLIIFPISLGICVFAPMRTRDRLKTFLAFPFACLIAMILIVIGWGDWPDLPPGYDGYGLKAVFGLGAIGLVGGIVMRFKGPPAA